MSISTVRFQPTMTKEQMVTALNHNFALVENLNISQIFKDETGTRRIILGKFPNGTYGLAISKPGEDVITLLGT